MVCDACPRYCGRYHRSLVRWTCNVFEGQEAGHQFFAHGSDDFLGIHPPPWFDGKFGILVLHETRRIVCPCLIQFVSFVMTLAARWSYIWTIFAS